MAGHNCGKMPIEYQYLFSVFTKISLNFICLKNSNCIYFLISPVDHKYTLEIKWGRKPYLLLFLSALTGTSVPCSGFVNCEPAKTIADSPFLSISLVERVRLTEDLMKLRWLNYFLVLILFNVLLHVFYLYLLLGAHDSLDSTASSLYSFEQVSLR